MAAKSNGIYIASLCVFSCPLNKSITTNKSEKGSIWIGVHNKNCLHVKKWLAVISFIFCDTYLENQKANKDTLVGNK